MIQTPDQILQDGIAEKERSIKDVGNKGQKVSVNGGKVVVTTVPDMVADVRSFHEKFGIQYSGPPRPIMDVPDMIFRMKRTGEEVRELYDAHEARQSVEFLDAHVDLIYILLGTIHLCGYDFNEAWRRVHAANMLKERASKKNPGKYGTGTDIVKPEGWVAPSLRDLI